MPFAVVCPSCRGTHVLDDEPAGQSVRCEHCGRAFAATSERAPESRRPGLHWYTRGPDEPELDESHIPRGVVAGLAVGALACLGGLALLVWAGTWFLSGGRGGLGARLQPPEPVWAPEPPPKETWRVRPKPVPPLAAPARWREGMLQLRDDERLVYGFGASPFALVLPQGHLPGRVWNLAEMEHAWPLPNDGAARAPFALSPDGRTVACLAGSSGPLAVKVWSAGDGQQARQFAARGLGSEVDWLAFPDDQQLLALAVTPSGRQVCRWALADGKLDPPFGTIAPQTSDAVAVSRSGQLLALFGGDLKVKLYDVPEGVEVGELDVSSRPDAAHLICRGLAFAPDVSELTAVFTHGQDGAWHLLSWKLSSGELRLQRVYSPEEVFRATGIAVLGSPGVAWAPDGSGWLLGGRMLLDWGKGKYLWTAARPTDQFASATAHFVGPRHLALLQERRGARRLTVIPLPKKELATARTRQTN